MANFQLDTPQKPFEDVIAKRLMQATPRVQCLLMRILQYDFNVRYIKGSTYQHTDCLSILGILQDIIKLPIGQIHEATAQDDNLCSLKHIMQPGWPSQKQEHVQVGPT